jgi:hypothetical protein
MDVSSRYPKTINHFGAENHSSSASAPRRRPLAPKRLATFCGAVALLNDIAQMDGDTEPDAPLGRQPGIAAGPLPYVKRNKNDAADAEAAPSHAVRTG